jgi:hypothetical protein
MVPGIPDVPALGGVPFKPKSFETFNPKSNSGRRKTVPDIPSV